MDSFGMEENMCWADMVDAEEEMMGLAREQPKEEEEWTPVPKKKSKPIPILGTHSSRAHPRAPPRSEDPVARRVAKPRFRPRE